LVCPKDAITVGGEVLGCLTRTFKRAGADGHVHIRRAVPPVDGLFTLVIWLGTAFSSVRLRLLRLLRISAPVSRGPTACGECLSQTIARALANAATLEEALGDCLRALGSGRGAIAVLREGRLVTVAQHDPDQEATHVVSATQLTPELYERVRSCGEAFRVDGANQVTDLVQSPSWIGMAACLFVPLRVLGATRGVLVAGYCQDLSSDHVDSGLLRVVGQQLGMALAHCQHSNSEHQTLEELSVLQEIDGQLASDLNVDDICETIANGARRLIAADASFLGLKDSAGNLVLFRSSGSGLSTPMAAPFARVCWRDGEGLAVSGVETRIVTDMRAEPPPIDPTGFLSAEGFTSWMGAPFQAACPVQPVPAPAHIGQSIPSVRPRGRGEWGEVGGVLYVANRTAASFSSHQAQLLTGLATRTAVSIGKSCLFHILERSKQEWEATVDAIEDICLAVDPDYTVRRCNRAAAAVRGLTPQQVVGRKCYEVFHEQGEPIEDCLVARSLRTGEEAFVESFDPSQGRVYHRWAYPLFDDRGEIWTVVEYSRDVTAFKRAQAQLLQQERVSDLRQTISGAAHELNNPLAVIIGYSQLLLQDSHNPEEIKGGLDSIYRQALRAREVVQNLQTFAPVQLRGGPDEPTHYLPVDVNQLLRYVLGLRDYTLRQAGVKVGVELASDLPWVSGDRSQLQQAFLDIVTGSERALVGIDGSRQLSIESRLCEEGDITVSFTDNGPSIPPSTFSKLFIPFLTIDETSQENPRRGLSTSSGIVQKHGGRIWAQNNPEGGATFLVTLPASASNEGLAQAQYSGLPDASPVGPLHTEGIARIVRRILVVDSDHAIVASLQCALEPRGYEVDAVFEAQLALTRLRERIYDLVVLDVDMRGPDGRQLYDLVYERVPILRQRVVFSMGDTPGVGTQRFLRERGLPCLVKPFDLAEVHRVVEQRISHVQSNGHWTPQSW
jgi:PAS domain S-box-containing protein